MFIHIPISAFLARHPKPQTLHLHSSHSQRLNHPESNPPPSKKETKFERVPHLSSSSLPPDCPPCKSRLRRRRRRHRRTSRRPAAATFVARRRMSRRRHLALQPWPHIASGEKEGVVEANKCLVSPGRLLQPYKQSQKLTAATVHQVLAEGAATSFSATLLCLDCFGSDESVGWVRKQCAIQLTGYDGSRVSRRRERMIRKTTVFSFRLRL